MQITWELATGYDFFVSLWSLFSPTSFGLRGRWASGMRARLPNDARVTIEQVESLVFDKRPSHWVYTLPPPKDGQTVLRHLSQIPAGERLITLALRLDGNPEVNQCLRQIAAAGKWTQADYEFVQRHHSWHDGGRPAPSAIRDMLDLWADGCSIGEKYLEALEIYFEVFFAQEERRLLPLLEEALERTRQVALEWSLDELLEHFARNSRWRVTADCDRWVFAPSVWVTPWLFTTKITPDQRILLFAALTEAESDRPGTLVPPDLVQGLKAVADATRLAILQHLSHQALTPSMLATKLHLRPATVSHHLKVLSQVGLVNPGVKQGKERSYTARLESLEKFFAWTKLTIDQETAE